jgi:hypothetical protein
MKYLLFVTGLIFAGLCGCAQSVDSAVARKLTLKERRRQQIMRMMEKRDREMHMTHEERLAEIEARPYFRADSAHWSVSFNPFSWLELQGALGLGIGYSITRDLQVWVESSGLFQFYQKPAQSCLGGIREILAVKYYFGPRRSLFCAGEFRYKNVYFHDVNNFYTNDTVKVNNFTYKIQDIIFGGAVWFGGQIRISNNHRWRLEPSIGWGIKGRTVVWHDVPAGYTYQKSVHPFQLFPNPVRTPERATVYFPATVRVVYVL